MPGEEILYKTLAREGEGRFTDRRSEFIGYAAPVSGEEAAASFVSGVRGRHPGARHVVFAYSVRNGAVKKYSDDGEPQGSAGRPVLGVLEKEEIDGAVIAVVRYFGGILLGTGGLVRAYSSAASAAVAAAGIARLRLCAEAEVTIDYNGYSKLLRLLPAVGATAVSQQFGTAVSLSLLVPAEKLETLREAVRDVSSGSASFTVTGTKFA
ncbi:MAG: YigZ family protein [Clostridia bacterium]|nr:YigZ family protein [Clostridia bacterium]